MKQLTLLILFLAAMAETNATTIIAQVNNGKWSTSSCWSKNRQPVDGDTVIVPAGIGIKVDGTENLDAVVIIVRGSLIFTNGKLRLDALSKVIVDFGGTITGGG